MQFPDSLFWVAIVAAVAALVSRSVKVHLLRKDGERLVGLELVSRSIASYSIITITLSTGAALSLAALLQQVVPPQRSDFEAHANVWDEGSDGAA